MNLAAVVFAERFTELVHAAFSQLWASGGCLPSSNVLFWVLAWTVSNVVISLSHTRIVGVVFASAFMLWTEHVGFLLQTQLRRRNRYSAVMLHPPMSVELCVRNASCYPFRIRFVCVSIAVWCTRTRETAASVTSQLYIVQL
jgi:hypothetical protein